MRCFSCRTHVRGSLTRLRSSSLQAQKTALKAAKKSAPKGGPKPRELLKQRAIDAAREKDSGKGKGWF